MVPLRMWASASSQRSLGSSASLRGGEPMRPLRPAKSESKLREGGHTGPGEGGGERGVAREGWRERGGERG
eukprot:5263242-Prymnesium_polylepis.1